MAGQLLKLAADTTHMEACSMMNAPDNAGKRYFRSCTNLMHRQFIQYIAAAAGRSSCLATTT